MTSSPLFHNRAATKRLSPNIKMVYSHSTNGLDSLGINSSGIMRQSTDDSLDILSLPRQTRPTFDIITDPQLDNDDFLYDDQDRKSQISDSMFDDQQSLSSPDKKQKQTLSTKLLKPFQIMRRKKSNAS